MRQGAALPARESLAWLLERSPNVVVIPGTTSMEHLEDNVGAWDLTAAADAPLTHSETP